MKRISLLLALLVSACSSAPSAGDVCLGERVNLITKYGTAPDHEITNQVVLPTALAPERHIHFNHQEGYYAPDTTYVLRPKDGICQVEHVIETSARP